ncbi:UDP-glucose 4-epimerase GalE [Halomonas sp. DP1Y21-3]|uniref:UDP-glucose 4-epimerase GalE n=1 Tax=Halomonas sp. DP1Y21-3 TaxID=2859080 RepID=UPI001C961A00|nr:UDP-glucose 4-epimerase GalE [Halomonas sp. DP1Y21-3]MBY6112784.1 UDP-glucose 4-epimerase GalE [Halomonas sp. DP1Y21-3]
MTVLVTGGAGYIGSHMVLSLLEKNFDVVVLDNFSNSSNTSIRRVSEISGRRCELVAGDIRDKELVKKVLMEYEVSDVLHFAGLKAVGESVEKPIEYYENNVGGTLSLCEAMKEVGVKRLVFSSSATVYGDVEKMPIDEDTPTGNPSNPYGRSKLMVEEILKDLVISDSSWSIALLRYFNPVGAHVSGRIGEDPQGIPNNLVPYIAQVAVGRLDFLSIYGHDYPTKDGTGVRDYIHVSDLVEGHLAAMKKISESPGVGVWNLGTGRGVSVLEMIKAFEKTSGRKIPYRFVNRRKGDVAECWANPSKAESDLSWKAKRNICDMVKDTWNWQVKNPNGYS